jgi:hypothetical protein
MSKKLITASISSAIIAILLIVKVDDIPVVYNSLINKYIVCSIFTISLVLSIIGSHKARVIWLGFLPFFAYSYFISIFRVFLKIHQIHYPLISLLSIIAFICGYLSIDIKEIEIKKTSRAPFKSFAIFIILLITMFIFLRLVWYQIELNEISDLFLLPLQILAIFAFDGRFLLIVFFIMYIIAFILLCMNEPWGYVLSTIILISHAVPAITFILAIITGGHSAIIYGPRSSRYFFGGIDSIPVTTFSLFLKGLPSFFALILVIIFISYFKEDTFEILTKKLKIIGGKRSEEK